MDFIRIAVELSVGFISLFIVTQLLGKTQITQITPFDFISALVLGELVGNALYDPEVGVDKILYSLTLWGILIYLLEFITQKWRRSRKILEGRPSLVIYEGKINRKELKRSKLDLNQLQHLLRAKGAFSIREVEYAVLETDGSVSVLKKHGFANPTNADLSIPYSKPQLAVTLISDGDVIYENLQEFHLSVQWLLLEIKKQGFHNPSDILLAEYEEGKPLYILPFTEEKL